MTRFNLFLCNSSKLRVLNQGEYTMPMRTVCLRFMATFKYSQNMNRFHKLKCSYFTGMHSNASKFYVRQFHRTVNAFKDEKNYNKDVKQETKDDEEGLYISKEDAKYQQLLREHSSIQGAGHRVLVIQPDIKKGSKTPKYTTPELQLAEACALIDSLPTWTVVQKMIVPVYQPKLMEVFSSTRMNDIAKEIHTNKDITAVFISSDHLYKYQIEYLKKQWNVPIVDRYQVVLHIFREHATSREAKLQIALAEIPFIWQRLDDLEQGTHDLQTGGHHYIGGQEVFSQTRSKLLKQREKKIQQELMKVRRQREMVRKNRQSRLIPTVAVVGYTNCGKTTLIKKLTDDSRMMPEDKLFATLDITSHSSSLPNNLNVVYLDTVGFISDIPTTLIEAFSATLQDAMIADVIIHLKDVSHPDILAQEMSVKKTLSKMLSRHQFRKIVTVGNKVDLVDKSTFYPESDVIYISASTGQGLSVLEQKVQQRLIESTGMLEKKIRIPMKGPQLRWLYSMATIRNAVADKDSEHLLVDIIINENIYNKFKAHFGKPTTRKQKLEPL